MPTIKLQSNDNEIYEADTRVARLSGTIRTVLDDCGMEEGDDMIVPLPNVDSRILERFITWADHHKDEPQLYDDDEKRERGVEISEWDADFLNVDQGNFHHFL